uniref:Integrase catalytic domain-containing protein n=1 Tax=Lactuca sativa TaxID=4236 RepID=A0A9R1XSL0_LACSA|nr:hypothetical protein LSAT_V11C200069570 [Lactuca sativa]
MRFWLITASNRTALTPSYNCQRDKWTLNELISFCVQEEERMKQETTESAHFASTSKGKGKRKRKEAATKGPVQKKQHLGNDQKKKESGPPKCFFCQEPSHLKPDCPKYHAWRVKKGIIRALVCSEGCLNYRKPNDVERYIYVGDGKQVEVKAIGTFHTCIVPSFRHNLVSVSKLDKSGYYCSFGNGEFSLSLNSNVIGTGSLTYCDKLYMLDIVTSYNETLHVDSRGTKRKLNNENSATLWHKCLGRISKMRIDRLVSDEVLSNLNFTDLKICVECIKGKQTKTKRLDATRSSDVLELIHTDICGPFPSASWNGQQYFISFIDDYSRYGYLYLIHEKSQSLEVFKSFKLEVENQLNKKIKCVRSDRGGEYYGRYDGSGEQRPGPFAKFLEECGIVPQYTMPGSPSMNGVSERRNRTLKDMGKSLVKLIFVSGDVQLRQGLIGQMKRNWTPKPLAATSLAILNDPGDVEFGGRNKVRDIVFEEESISIPTVTFDNTQINVPVGEEVIQEPQQDNVIHSPVHNEQPQQPQLRRSTRERRSAIPSDFHVYLQENEEPDGMIENDPINFSQAMQSSNSQKWIDAMNEEYKSMQDNKVWDLIPLPEGTKPIGCKWIFKTKRDSKGNVERHKARLVAKGYTQKEGIDFKETFSPVSTKDTFRLVMALVAHYNLELHQMDVKTAFLNGDIDETIYMVQPENFVSKESKEMDYHKRAILKRSLKDLACKTANQETPLFQKETNSVSINALKNDLEVKEMQKIPYASVVGSLMYAQVCTRPDISFIVGMLGRYLSNPGMDHWKAAKRVLRYLQRTKDYMLTYRKSDVLEIIGYSDSDFAGCQENYRSTSGYIYLLAGGAILWKSAKQTLVTSSTMAAEFVACFEASDHAIWLRNLVTGLRIISIERPLKLYCDNKSAVLYSNNNRSSTKSRHIDIKFLIVKEKVQNGKITIEHIGTNSMIADPLTKGLPPKWEFYNLLLGALFWFKNNYVFLYRLKNSSCLEINWKTKLVLQIQKLQWKQIRV